MKKISFVLVSLFLAFQAYSQTAPKIIKTTPEFGDWNVDYNLKEILIEFDQDMGESYSIVSSRNGHEAKTCGVVWKTKRLASVCVKLSPDNTYHIPLNSLWYRNFQNTQGIALNPTTLIFHTKRGKPDEIKKENEKKYDDFCSYFTQHYSYKDLKGTDWNIEFKNSKNEIINSATEYEFGIRLLKILKKTDDTHMSLSIGNEYFSIADERLQPRTYNYNYPWEKLENSVISKNKKVMCGKQGNIGLIGIFSLNGQFPDDINTAIEFLKQYKDLPNLIIDLRRNGGGDDGLARKFTSYLVKDSIQYEKVIVFNDKTQKFDRTFINSVKTTKDAIDYKGNIYVLISGEVASSCESFVLMLKQLPNVKIVGSKTFGSSGNPKEYKVSDEIIVRIPSWQAYDLKGNLIEGKGIEPDILSVYPEKDFEKGDPIFDEVVKMINK